MSPAFSNINAFLREIRFPSKRITGNALWLLAGRVGTQALMVAFTVIVARKLGQDGFGQYAYIASIIFLVNVATTFGTDMIVIRSVAAENSLNSLPAAILVQLVLSTASIGLITVVPGGWLNLNVDGTAALRIYSLALIPMSIVSVVSAGLRGQEKMRLTASLGAGSALLQVILVWFTVFSAGGVSLLVQILLVVQVASALAGAALYYWMMPRGIPVWWPSAQTIGDMMRTSFPMALLSGLGIFYQRAAIYMTMLLAGPTATGWFSAAWRAVEVPKLGHYSLMGALLPLMARSHPSNDNAILHSQVFTGSFYASLGVSGGGALLMSLAARPLVDIVFGPGYAPATLILQILTWVLLPYTITNYLSLRVLAAGEERRLLVPQLVAVLVLIPLSLWAIPKWAGPAAAVAVVVSEIVLALGYSAVWLRVRSAHQNQV